MWTEVRFCLDHGTALHGCHCSSRWQGPAPFLQVLCGRLKPNVSPAQCSAGQILETYILYVDLLYWFWDLHPWIQQFFLHRASWHSTLTMRSLAWLTKGLHFCQVWSTQSTRSRQKTTLIHLVGRCVDATWRGIWYDCTSHFMNASCTYAIPFIGMDCILIWSRWSNSLNRVILALIAQVCVQSMCTLY